MKKEDVKKLFQDENFLKELNEVNSMETLQRFLSQKGIEMSISDIDVAIKKGSQTELSEEELKNISGGAVWKWIKFAWDCFMFNPLDVY